MPDQRISAVFVCCCLFSHSHHMSVSVVGDYGVGKSSLIHRIVYDSFSGEPITTIGFEPCSKYVDNPDDGTRMQGQFWDAYGSERFGSLRAAFYRGAHAVLVCYDTTNVNTFRSVEDRWFKELEGMIGAWCNSLARSATWISRGKWTRRKQDWWLRHMVATLLRCPVPRQPM